MAGDDQFALGRGAIILRESRLWTNVPFGGLFALALARGTAGAQTTGGLVAVSGRLEVNVKEITYVDGKGKTVTLPRQQGELLRVVEMGAPRFPRRCLTARGTSTVIPMKLFKLSEVRRACLAKGWQIDQGVGPTSLCPPRCVPSCSQRHA